MALTIWKFPLTLGVDVLDMPKSAKVLTVQTQGETPCLWALVDTNAPTERRSFRTFGTGHKIPDNEKLDYICTYQLDGGQFIFHVFEEKVA